MDYVIAIFLLGLMVTAVVAKGMLLANDFAASQTEPEDVLKQADDSV